MSNPTPETITEAIRNVNLATFGPSAADYGVPTFTTEEQVARFIALQVRIQHQHETRNGVAWRAIVTDGDHSFRAEQDGHGGANFYDLLLGEDTATEPTEEFANEVFPGDPEALDTLIAAREVYGLAPTPTPTVADELSPAAAAAFSLNQREVEARSEGTVIGRIPRSTRTANVRKAGKQLQALKAWEAAGSTGTRPETAELDLLKAEKARRDEIEAETAESSSTPDATPAPGTNHAEEATTMSTDTTTTTEGRRKPTDDELTTLVKGMLAQGMARTAIKKALRADGIAISSRRLNPLLVTLTGTDKPNHDKAAATESKAGNVATMKKAADNLKAAGRYAGPDKIMITPANAADLAAATPEQIKAMPAETTPAKAAAPRKAAVPKADRQVTPRPKADTAKATASKKAASKAATAA